MDTETTGIGGNGRVSDGHRLVEIGCVEMINRKVTGKEFHAYLNPGRVVDPKAVTIHGLTNEFLSDKPTFKDIADEFLGFISDSVVVIHNASFDLSFIDKELRNIGKPPLNVDAIDTLKIARDSLPGIKHTLDSLSHFFGVEKPRQKHGALLDARILADVYIAMTDVISKFMKNDANTTEHEFTTFVRTKTVFKGRLKDLKESEYQTVKVYVYELDKLGCNNGPLLYGLREKGEIWYDNNGNFRALRDGPIDPRLLERTRKLERVKGVLTPLHRYMRDQLMNVELAVSDDKIPVYFKAFLKHREEGLDAFFTVDAFSGRVHTPIVNLKHDLRKHLRFYGKPLRSLDVRQMQPTILAKVIHDSIGDNPLSNAVFSGEDVYELLQNRDRSIKSRAEAKKFLFQLIFGKPMNGIGRMFEGDISWVDWINHYKSVREPRNPHHGERHTNLAWLLQYNEVKIMCFIWERLWKRHIPFLTIHDDILCRPCDEDTVFKIMNEELSRHFKHFSIRVE